MKLIKRSVLSDISFKRLKKTMKNIRGRCVYGVGESDWWNLDSHLAAVLANGLELMAERGVSYPAFYADSTQWQDELKKMSGLCRWLYDYDDHESSLFDYYFSAHSADQRAWVHDSQTGHSIIHSSLESVDEVTQAQWRESLAALAQRRQQILEIVLEFLKENFFVLWD